MTKRLLNGAELDHVQHPIGLLKTRSL